jgi:ribosomal protein RSM22 (predicted rRNA methylase)
VPHSPLDYPASIETFWLKRASTSLKVERTEDVLDQLRPDVARLSDLFTIDRTSGFGRYGDEERARLAYGLFFFPQTYIRTRLVLDECLADSRWTPPTDRPVRVLDLGAGLGAGLLAIAHTLADRPATLCALDHSAGSLATLRDLFTAQGLTAETRAGHLLNPLPTDEKWDVILCSFALNEALENEPAAEVPAWATGLLQRLHPGGLLVFLEPALETAAQRLEMLRDSLAARGRGRIIAPCLHHLPCPLRREGRVWCHEVRRWQAPDATAYLNRHLFRDLTVLKFCFLALTQTERPEATLDPAHARLIAPVDVQNGKMVTRGCAADGQTHLCEVLNRHLTRDERTTLASTERGARLHWPDLKPLGDGRSLRASGKPVIEDRAPR